MVRETRGHARLEAQLADPDRPAGQNGAAAPHPAAARPDQLSTVQVVAARSWREPSLSMTAPTTTSAMPAAIQAAGWTSLTQTPTAR
jgi:hypothetical protein